ncbi:formylglycine-generating enzyme family protein [Candidatus Sumerlaeota bacterium]
MMRAIDGKCRLRLFFAYGVAACLVAGLCMAAVAAMAAGLRDGVDKKAVERPPENIKVPAAEVAALKAFKAEAWIVPGADIKMVRIPAGKFVMGSPEGEAHRFEDETQRAVTITKPFYMSAFEVTQKQFYKLTIPDYDFEGWTYFRGPIANGAAYHYRTSAGSFGRGLGLLLDNPMECVAWPKALEYCELINKREQAAGRLPKGYSYRLPTEAEWEYACRAGTKGMFNVEVKLDALKQQGSKGAELAKFAFFDPSLNTRGSKTSPVGKDRKANAWGLYDMHGNVAEWCLDTYAPYSPDKDASDPVAFGPGSEKVVRGGSFAGEYWFMRSASRYAVPFDADYYAFVGIRLVLAPRIEIALPASSHEAAKQDK